MGVRPCHLQQRNSRNRRAGRSVRRNPGDGARAIACGHPGHGSGGKHRWPQCSSLRGVDPVPVRWATSSPARLTLTSRRELYQNAPVQSLPQRTAGNDIVASHNRSVAMKKFLSTMLSTAVVFSASSMAGGNNGFLAPVAAPTLDEIGLGLLVVLLGVAGGYLARRKK